MEISKFTLTKETLNNSLLTPRRKAELRRQAILNLIDETPAGTPITLKEFAKVAHIKQDRRAWEYLQKMLKDGQIVKIPIEKSRTYSYANNTNCKIIHKKNVEVKTVNKPIIEEPKIKNVKLKTMRYIYQDGAFVVHIDLEKDSISICNWYSGDNKFMFKHSKPKTIRNFSNALIASLELAEKLNRKYLNGTKEV